MISLITPLHQFLSYNVISLGGTKKNVHLTLPEKYVSSLLHSEYIYIVIYTCIYNIYTVIYTCIYIYLWRYIYVPSCSRGFSGPQLASMMSRDASLSGGCTADGCRNSSQAGVNNETKKIKKEYFSRERISNNPRYSRHFDTEKAFVNALDLRLEMFWICFGFEIRNALNMLWIWD